MRLDESEEMVLQDAMTEGRRGEMEMDIDDMLEVIDVHPSQVGKAGQIVRV